MLHFLIVLKKETKTIENNKQKKTNINNDNMFWSPHSVLSYETEHDYKHYFQFDLFITGINLYLNESACYMGALENGKQNQIKWK